LSFGTDKHYGITSTRNSRDFPHGLLRRIMRTLILGQQERWNSTPESQRQFIRIDQSDLFYDLRKRLADLGFNVDPLAKGRKREDIVSYIKEYCEDTLKVKRHEIGIFAADRAILLFKDVEYSVNFENIRRLMIRGADLICIEKEGIVEKLGPFVKKFGIALLHSKGFIAENGIMLAQAAKEYNANVAILSDFDAAGISLAISLQGIQRIGVDFDTIDDINNIIDEINKNPEEKAKLISKYPEVEEILNTKLTIELLQEKYNPADHWTQLLHLSNGEYRDKKDGQYWSIYNFNGEKLEHLENYRDYLNKEIGDTKLTYLEFLQEKRFELNTIRKEVGSEIFWRWLREKILKKFPIRDYNRGVFFEDYYLTPTMIQFIKGLKKYSGKILKDSVDKKREHLLNYEGLTDVYVKTDEINSDLIIDLHSKPEIFLIDKRLEQMMRDFGGLSDG
jgi:hypothetical protein